MSRVVVVVILLMPVLLSTSGCWKKFDILRPPAKHSTYVGATVCGKCHQEIYEDYLTSGHGQQFNWIRADQAPDYYWAESLPFPVTDPPPGLTWDDISLVLGGHYGFAVFFDQDGNLIAGPESYWNVQTGAWADYDPGRHRPYDCASCHTSGYDPDGTQVEFPGMKGSWEQSGVTCEGCHGPGRAHAKSRQPADILVDTSEGFCLACHRGNAAKGGHPVPGFGDVPLGNSHQGACSMCHNPHVSWEYEPARSLWRDCADCHQANDARLKDGASARDGQCRR